MDRGIPLPRRFKKDDLTQYGNVLRGQLAGQIHQYQDRLTSFGRPQVRGNMSCQIVRSCGTWSHGCDKEHSIADAYAAIIRNSEHCIYIENESFITATGDQKPVQNKIGAAIVERILRAARASKKYKVIVVIPCSPGFAGDLSGQSAASVRAIMESQYNSINRGGNSIMEMVAKEGYNPMEYIRFYNLRTYDRINMGSMAAELDSTLAPGYGPTSRSAFDPTAPYQQAQKTSTSLSGRWDSVSECNMLNGEDIRKVPWEGPSEAEIDAFVTEELHVHSKVCSYPQTTVLLDYANSTGYDRGRPDRHLRLSQHHRQVPTRRPRLRNRHDNRRLHSYPLHNGQQTLHSKSIRSIPASRTIPQTPWSPPGPRPANSDRELRSSRRA